MALRRVGSSGLLFAVVLLVTFSTVVMVAPNNVATQTWSSTPVPSYSASRLTESGPTSTPAASPSATTWEWVNPATAIAPSPRAGAAMVYDAADGYTLLFGGCPSWGGDYWVHNCTAIGDTWKLAGGVWTNITSSLTGPSPPARADAGIAYDSLDRVVVMFGGFDRFTVYGDTWTYAAGRWTPMHPESSPAARIAPGMAEDAAGGVVLFGGANSTLNTVTYDDTWSYVGGDWTQLSTATPPAARFSMAMAYDANGGFDLMYGGFNASAGSFGDTWSFANGVWTELYASSLPPPENYPTMVFDPNSSAMIMTGGHVGYDVFNATWAYDSAGWRIIPTLRSPTPSWGLSMSYDPSTGVVWLFGGYYATIAPHGVYLGATWELATVSTSVSTNSTSSAASFSWLTFFIGALVGGVVALGAAAVFFVIRPKHPPITPPLAPLK